MLSKKLATGYAAGLSKHELAKQLIHHASSWKPTKLGSISREKEIDTALTVAWKSIIKGTWQPPLEWAKAEILNYEYQYYRKKYQESGIISNELPSLESLVRKLLGSGYISLEEEIKKYPKLAGVDNKDHQHSLTNKNPALSTIQDDYCDDHDHHYKQHQEKLHNNNISHHNNYLSQNHRDHNRDIELPSYPEEQEYYLSKSCGFISSDTYDSNLLSDIDQNHNMSLPSSTNLPADAADDHHACADQILDLSDIAEQQKYLRMTASEKNDDMIIKTVNNGEYLFKLKSMESGGEGEVIMTMKHVKLETFIKDITGKFDK